MPKKIRTKSHFRFRVFRLSKMLDLPDGYKLELHCYTPGRENLYKIHLLDAGDNLLMALPEDFSYNSHDFEIYLDGITVGGTDLGIYWRDD